jgi:mannose-1-phosphate guanylyltransferase
MEKTDRAWGHYLVLDEHAHYKLKEIIVAANRCLSYQRHEYRDELWYVKQGKGTLILDDESHVLRQHSIVVIKRGQWHQLINGTNEELRIIEIQHGDSCNEEDIERQ